MFKPKRIVLVLVLLFVVLQLVPYGRDHTNPPVGGEPQWSSPRVRELAKRACFDCHSNETAWPWYSNVAPFSWLVQRDVDEGRGHLNFSTFATSGGDADEAAELTSNGEMPPWFYLPLHPDAKLSDAEKRELADGFTATFGAAGGKASAETHGETPGESHGGARDEREAHERE
ncbi:MAG: heme-binding domain-containing protein [Planctomycetes bacterium]|nr:heme-binding domain-containing protein [Planctomycetota bacterium]